MPGVGDKYMLIPTIQIYFIVSLAVKVHNRNELLYRLIICSENRLLYSNTTI